MGYNSWHLVAERWKNETPTENENASESEKYILKKIETETETEIIYLRRAVLKGAHAI